MNLPIQRIEKFEKYENAEIFTFIIFARSSFFSRTCLATTVSAFVKH